MRINPILFLSALVAGKVVKLTDTNFKSVTKIGSGAQEKVWFVKFYAPWCPHCKMMAKDWEKMSDSVTNDIMVGEVDATSEDELAKRFDITGFPRMYLFNVRSNTLFDRLSQINGDVYKYPGARKAEAFAAFAQGGFKTYDPVATTV